jgi:hypothetical protein
VERIQHAIPASKPSVPAKRDILEIHSVAALRWMRSLHAHRIRVDPILSASNLTLKLVHIADVRRISMTGHQTAVQDVKMMMNVDQLQFVLD